jgi:two-component system response regulator MtrA
VLAEGRDIMDTEDVSVSNRHRGREYNVLIVEDETGTRELLKTAVNAVSLPCRIAEAATSEAALQAARMARPDLVLLDIVLPGSETSGVLLCQQFCKDTRTKVVVVTGQAQDSVVAACLSAGAVERVSKPFSVSDLQGKIEAWLRG